MIKFRITLWSQEENCIVSDVLCDGNRADAERNLSELWNESRAVVAESGRFRARLYEVGNRKALSAIG